jgi:SAM-dependent methyltransferase
MKSISGVGLADVQRVYGGPEGRLWELVMGQQIHIGGLRSSLELAQKAGIRTGTSGVDLCCCSGAGMRVLVRLCGVARMHGVDATPSMVELGRCRSAAESLTDRITFVEADACDTGLPEGGFDFVWGEDAWCYVVDKPRLIAEAARLVRPGGTIAFTDWVEGPTGLTAEEADRWLRFMKFPSVEDLAGYARLLEACGCEVILAEDTGRFAPYVDLYLNMLDMQLAYDALGIIGFDRELMQAMSAEMQFMRGLAHAGKIAQGRFVARKRTGRSEV